ncbi:MAG: GNAT family N-acetyltransferase [Alteromonadales bacterium]|nr:GNAT family N-acetyltransferase [Alteromonadales bacterium]
MENERIILASPSVEQAEKILEAVLESKNELSEFMPWLPYALTLEDSISNTETAISNYFNFEKELRFAIMECSSERLLGMISLIISDKSVPYFEIGYWLRTTEVGNGYVTDAIKMLESYAFNELKAKRVAIKTAKSNLKSQAVAERSGYELEAVLANARRLPSGELDSTLIYSKLGL